MKFLFILFFLVIKQSLFAHPVGDMIIQGDKLVWVYIYPIRDINHKACVMVWDNENGVRKWLVSEYSGSDWMISKGQNEDIYLIERYFSHQESTFFFRVFNSKIEGDLKEIIPWSIDTLRIGEAGFYVKPDTTITFVKYPNVYSLSKNKEYKVYNEWVHPIKSIRNIDSENFILVNDSSVWLVDKNFNILNEWNNLLLPIENNLPFGGNRISDLCYDNGALYLAYWGNHSFDKIFDNKRSVIVKYSSPWVPHHIAVNEMGVFMLASTIAPEITNEINPSLYLYKDGKTELLWGESINVTSTENSSKKNNDNIKLYQNYTNPFNPNTTISFELKNGTRASLIVYDVLGNKVAELFNEFALPNKTYEVIFNAINLASGIYYYALITNFGSQIKKMVLLK